MTIIQITTSDKNKCGSCKFFIPQEGDWFFGKCVSNETKVKDKDRFYTSKKCASKRNK
ncbi:MAG: hypothetical protein WC554_18990 [Clostridia bacterium]|jgi:hypothetical protein